MKKFKKFILFSMIASPSVVATACTIEKANLTDGLLDFDWIIPSTGEITYNQNLLFWSLIANSINAQESLRNDEFVSILNSSGIFQNPITNLPTDSKVEVINPNSSFNLLKNSDFIQFKVKGKKFTKRFEIKWQVSYEQDQYLDILISTIKNQNFETTLSDHNRLVRFVTEHPDREWQVDSTTAINLISVILDLDKLNLNKDFYAKDILITKFQYSPNFLKLLHPSDLGEINKFSLSLEVSHVYNETISKRNIDFSWEIQNSSQSGLYGWEHTSKLGVNLTDFNNIVDSINDFKNSTDYLNHNLNANSILEVIDAYIPSNDLKKFDTGVKIVSLSTLSLLTNSSNQETLKMLVIDNSGSEAETRNIKIDFLVHASNEDLLNSWNLPNNFEQISLDNLYHLLGQLRLIDQSDQLSASKKFWSLISNSLKSSRLSPFPSNVRVNYDIDQLEGINNLTSGETFSFKFFLTIGGRTRNFVLHYQLLMTQLEQLSNLNYGFIYNLSESQFNSLKLGLNSLNLNDSGIKINQTFQNALPEDFSKPKFPEFSLLGSKINLENLGLPIIDLKIDLKLNSSNASVQVPVARIFLAADNQEALDNMQVDDTVPVIEKPILTQIQTEVQLNIKNNRSSLIELYHYLKFWLPPTSMPSKVVVNGIDWSTNLSNGQTGYINIQIQLGDSSKLITHNFTYYEDLYASGVKWKPPSRITTNSVSYINFTNQVNSLRPHGVLLASVLNDPLNNLIQDDSLLNPISDNLGNIYSIGSLPIYNGNQKFVTFNFTVQKGQTLETYSVLITIEDTIEQSLASWDLMRPKSLMFDAIDYNNWYHRYKDSRVFETSDADAFLYQLYANSGLIGSLSLPVGAKILNWSVPFQNYIFSTRNFDLNLHISTGHETKNFTIEISVFGNPQTTLKSYVSFLSSGLKSMRLNSTEYNSFTQSIVNNAYQSANSFVRNFNQFSNNHPLPLFDNDVQYKVINELEYHAIDQYGNYSFAIEFRYHNELSTETKLVFAAEVSPDYDHVLNQFESGMLDSQHDSSLSYSDFKKFGYLFNDAIATPDNYLRSLKVISTLFRFNLIRNLILYLGGIELNANPISASLIPSSNYELKISYTAPGFNIWTVKLKINISRSLKDEAEHLQSSISDKDISYRKFVEFANKWNSYNSSISDNRVGILINQTFGDIFNLSKLDVFKVSDMDLGNFSSFGISEVNSNIYVLSVQISNRFGSQVEREILYLTFAIDVDDDAILSNNHITDYSVSGTQKRFKDLFNFVNENDYRGTSGKNNLLNQIYYLFGSRLNLRLHDFNFRKIRFIGNWTQANLINNKSYLLIEYGYRQSRDTKLFKLLVNVSHSIDNVREDLSNVVLSKLNYRSFLNFDESLIRSQSLSDIDNTIRKYSSLSSAPNFSENWGNNLSLVSVTKLTEISDYSGNDAQKYLLVLRWSQEGSRFDLSTLLTVPVEYDLSDQTSNWTAKNLSTSFDSSNLIEIQTSILSKYVQGQSYDATSFAEFIASKLVFRNNRFPVSFPIGSTVKIPETGLINNTHLFARTKTIKIEFELVYLQNTFNLSIEVDYQRTDFDLFQMYRPFVSLQEQTKTVEMLPSEYNTLRKDLNLTFDMSALMKVNAEVALEVIEPFLLKSGYIRQMTVPRGELSLYISPYSIELPELDELNGSFKEVTVKIGITTPSSSLINYFEFSIHIKTDLIDIVKNSLPNTIWRSVEQVSPLTLAAQKKFSNNLKLVDKNNAITYTNLLTPAQLTSTIESELGMIVDRNLNVPKPTGNKEIMFGFTKRGEDEIVKTPSYAIYHTDDLAGNEFRPLTKTAYNHFKQYTIDEIPQTSIPSFLDNPANHPLQRQTVSNLQVNSQAMNFAASSNYVEFDSEEMVEKIIFNSWLNYHQKYYSSDSNIPISRMRKAAINGIEPPVNKIGNYNPLYDYYPMPEGPIDLETYTISPGNGNYSRMHQRPINPPKKNDAIKRRPVNTHGIPVVAETQMPTRFPYLTDPASGLFEAASSAEIQHFLNSIPEINSSKMLRKLGQAALDSRMLPSLYIYQNAADGFVDIRYIDPELINSQNLLAWDSLNQIVDIHKTNFTGDAFKKPYFVTRLSSNKPLPDNAFHVSKEWRERFPDRYYFKRASWDMPNHILDDPSLFITRRDWQLGRINMYAVTNQDQALHQYLFKGPNAKYREAVDIIDERWAGSFFNTPNQIHQSAVVRRTSQVKPTNTVNLAQQYANSWETRHAPTIQTINHDVKPSSLVMKGKKLQPADAKTRYLKGKLPPIEKPTNPSVVDIVGDNVATTIGHQTTNIRAKVNQSSLLGKSIDITHAIPFERDLVRASTAKSLLNETYDELAQSSFWSSTTDSACGRVVGSRCVNVATQNIKSNRIQLKANQIKAALSRGWRTHVTKVLGIVGGLVTVGSLFATLFSMGIIPGKNSSDHFENRYDNRDYTIANGVVRTNRHQVSAFMVERNSSGHIVSVQEVQKFSLNVNTDVGDYREESRPTNFSKPMEFLVNQLVNESEIPIDFLNKKVPINLQNTPEAFKNNASMFSGSWMGYLQMFPLTQGIETIEATWEVLNDH